MNIELIPEFRDIKENPENLGNPVMRGILAGCLFDGSPEGIDKVIERYRANNSQNLYCWAENGEITGVCGFEAHPGYVEVLHIAVAESRRGRGIGGKMLSELRKRYGMALEAETDDDAVGFYRKCGFKTAAFSKYNTRRYKCVLPAPKTLYISDLDGTLLNKNAELSEYTINTLSKLNAKGVDFSLATARTAETVLSILGNTVVNIPIILMNGVLIYDIRKKRYLKKELIEKDKIRQIISAMRKTEITGLMYSIPDGRLITYYENLDNRALRDFVEERQRKYNKQFVQTDNFEDTGTEIIYFCFLDTDDNVHRLYDEIKDIDGLRIEMYRDIYYDNDNVWNLEIFSESASKYTAVQFLRENYGFERIVGFGDGLNDIPLFEACDECYAVLNAKTELKEKAAAVIGTNNEDGVAKWLEENVL